MTHPAQQKVINSVLNALKADNNTVKVGAFAETDIKNIPQAFGDNQKAQYQGSLEFNAGGENWDAKIRVNAEKTRKLIADMMLMLKVHMSQVNSGTNGSLQAKFQHGGALDMMVA